MIDDKESRQSLPTRRVSYWRRVVLIVVCVLVFAPFGYMMYVTRGWVTSQQLGRLKAGMAKKDVIVILGEPLNPKYDSTWDYHGWEEWGLLVRIRFDDGERLLDGH